MSTLNFTELLANLAQADREVDEAYRESEAARARWVAAMSRRSDARGAVEQAIEQYVTEANA